MDDKQLLDYLEGFITEERKLRFSEILQERTKFLTVAMEDVYQMHNTSAVIRSCDVFGIQEAHVIENRFGKRLDKNIAMGAQQWVDVHRYGTTSQCIDSLKAKGYRVVATSPHNDSCYLEDFKIQGKTAFLFGTEKEGLSEEALQKSDGFLKIPMLGFTESLNISVSAAIILQHLTTELRKTPFDWRLTEGEKLEKRLDWTKKSIKSIDKILARLQEV
ncbi:TrmH family RNA methyltransferase [Pseudozobellia thermophila]|uniref:tRNA (guanosine(18)-2'-O)-methyltransferase n=1 Tax=Pseudozobellia thermophila TaxID=192903 RepID=A0A1M6FES7_9FLAO|nr:RNA methyltransferase [Pseudozobellia thermophila]SHI96146.1 tRNA (guanosine-2'-O-)-methyltransferase [Pseudozobellia thermophila]